jgi:AraC family transcriptional regulator, regulatory protein of adaptative response / DNA-3-methyladenine glycosylase II
MHPQFTAVVTTGIYCREGCGGRPHRRNTRPYRFAAAAEADGFRPCLQCRPDREPEPGWVDAPELVCRALRLIADGALDGDTEDGLAGRLGVSARHLRRLFGHHVGVTPSEVARSRRAHFARRLLDDTDLPMSSITRAAGFQSVRHMNRVVKEVFRFTPQELRAKRRDPRRLVADGGLELRLPYHGPLAWDALLAFLAPRAIPGVEHVDCADGTYQRTMTLGGEAAVIQVGNEEARDALRLRAHVSDCEGLVHLVTQVRRLFDLDADPDVVDTHLARDPLLRPLVRRHRGLRVPGAVDPLEIGVRAILGQQVSVRHATALSGRLVARYGAPLPGVDALGLTHLFPTAQTLADAALDDIGIPRARADAIREFARTTVGLDGIALDGRLGLDTLVRELRRLPGIGEWTAQYVAMRAAGERDAFPAGDLGLRRALDGSSAGVAAAGDAFRPWRAYAAMHLWSSLDARPAQTRQPA